MLAGIARRIYFSGDVLIAGVIFGGGDAAATANERFDVE